MNLYRVKYGGKGRFIGDIDAVLKLYLGDRSIAAHLCSDYDLPLFDHHVVAESESEAMAFGLERAMHWYQPRDKMLHTHEWHLKHLELVAEGVLVAGKGHP